MTAQQFQDITGQTIKKVINLVNHVEDELLNLIKKFGMPVNNDIINKTSESPSVMVLEDKDRGTAQEAMSISECPEQEGDQVSQSDVEALLNDFGF